MSRFPLGRGTGGIKRRPVTGARRDLIIPWDQVVTFRGRRRFENQENNWQISRVKAGRDEATCIDDWIFLWYVRITLGVESASRLMVWCVARALRGKTRKNVVMVSSC